MPTLDIKKYNATTAQTVNAIINDSSVLRSMNLPVVTDNASLLAVGKMIIGDVSSRNAFADALVNRIAMVIVTSKSYTNKLAFWKKGLLEMGESIEEVFVGLAKAYKYDPAKAETDLFRREVADIKSAFHTLNYKTFYRATTSVYDLRQAFLSLGAMEDLLTKIISMIYSSAEYDEFLVTKYMIQRWALNGGFYAVGIPTVAPDKMGEIVTKIKGLSNSLSIAYKDAYNPARVKTISNIEDLHLVMDSDFDAMSDVEVLAKAFNIDYVKFLGNRVLLDSFWETDLERLANLFEDDPSYVPFTDAEIAQLKKIRAVLVDDSFFMIYDNMIDSDEAKNGQGGYLNYFYHVWKTFSVSPFANAILFTEETPAVTSVTVTPDTATVKKGNSLQLKAEVVTAGFARNGVKWEVTGSANFKSTISPTGLLIVPADEVGTTLTVTATSVFDGTKKDTATITLS